jgi:hypothetical protein
VCLELARMAGIDVPASTRQIAGAGRAARRSIARRRQATSARLGPHPQKFGDFLGAVLVLPGDAQRHPQLCPAKIRRGKSSGGSFNVAIGNTMTTREITRHSGMAVWHWPRSTT